MWIRMKNDLDRHFPQALLPPPPLRAMHAREENPRNSSLRLGMHSSTNEFIMYRRCLKQILSATLQVLKGLHGALMTYELHETLLFMELKNRSYMTLRVLSNKRSSIVHFFFLLSCAAHPLYGNH